MLEKIDFLSLDTAAIIVYTNSAVLQTLLKKRIKARFSIARNLTKYADSAATLKIVKNETITPPFGGGTWLSFKNSAYLTLSRVTSHVLRVPTFLSLFLVP